MIYVQLASDHNVVFYMKNKRTCVALVRYIGKCTKYIYRHTTALCCTYLFVIELYNNLLLPK